MHQRKRCQARKELAAGPFCTTHTRSQTKGLEIFFLPVFLAPFDLIVSCPMAEKVSTGTSLTRQHDNLVYFETYLLHSSAFVDLLLIHKSVIIPFRLGLGKVTHSHNAKVEPDWDLSTALWYVMVTATTVGGNSWQKQPAVTRCVLLAIWFISKISGQKGIVKPLLCIMSKMIDHYSIQVAVFLCFNHLHIPVPQPKLEVAS